MSLSQSLVLGWLHFMVASAIVLTLARLAMRWLPQPADRIHLVQIALATAMLLPVFIALSPLPMWELNLIPSEEERVAAPSRSTSLPADESPAMTIERSASPIVRDAPRLTTPPPSSVPQAATSPPLDLWMCCFIAIVAGHALAAMFFAIEWIIGRRRLGRLCADAVPANDSLIREWAAVSNGQGGRAKLLMSSAIDVPLMFGWRKPVVIVPRDLADAGGPSLRFCLSHEWSHIARADVLTWTAAWCCQFILWMHPAYWSLRKELRLCQDLLADATAASSDAVAYSELLVALARRRLPRPAGALTLIDRPSHLSRRVTMLLKRSFELRVKSSWKVSLVVATMAILGASILGGIRIASLRADEAKPDRPTVQTENDPGKLAPTTTAVVTTVLPPFEVVPITTELQKAVTAPDATVFVIVNADFFDSRNLDASETRLDELIRQLRKIPNRENSTLYLLVRNTVGEAKIVEEDGVSGIQPTSPDGRHTVNYVSHMLRFTYEGVAYEVGFKSVKSQEISFRKDDRFSWLSTIKDLRADTNGIEEQGIGNGVVKAYPVKTPLSRFLFHNADAVLHVSEPIDTMSIGSVSKLPDQAQQFVEQLKPAKKDAIYVMLPVSYDFGTKPIAKENKEVWRKLSSPEFVRKTLGYEIGRGQHDRNILGDKRRVFERPEGNDR